MNLIKRDIANYIEAIQDILVKYEVLKDDNYNIVYSLDGTRMYVDKENPNGTIVNVVPMNDVNDVSSVKKQIFESLENIGTGLTTSLPNTLLSIGKSLRF